MVAVRDGTVVGVVTAHTFASIHCDETVAWITTLVVDESARRQGIGRLLVTGAEEWVRAQGCDRIAVTSGLHRGDAHAFYRHIGWQETGRRYSRQFTEVG